MLTGVALIRLLTHKSIVITPNAATYIQENGKAHQNLTARELKELKQLIIDEAYINPQSKLKIETKHIKKAFDQLTDIQKQFDTPEKPDKEYEQRERHHEESLEQADHHWHSPRPTYYGSILRYKQVRDGRTKC